MGTLGRRTISIIMSVIMVLSCFAGMTFSVGAELVKPSVAFEYEYDEGTNIFTLTVSAVGMYGCGCADVFIDFPKTDLKYVSGEVGNVGLADCGPTAAGFLRSAVITSSSFKSNKIILATFKLKKISDNNILTFHIEDDSEVDGSGFANNGSDITVDINNLPKNELDPPQISFYTSFDENSDIITVSACLNNVKEHSNAFIVFDYPTDILTLQSTSVSSESENAFVEICDNPLTASVYSNASKFSLNTFAFADFSFKRTDKKADSAVLSFDGMIDDNQV